MPQSPAGNPPDPIAADLLGPLRLAVGGREIPDSAWPRRPARELLLLLLATPGHRLPRDRALDLLWPEASPSAARNALYKALHALRRVLEPELAAGAESAYVQVGAEAIALRPEARPQIDADAFEAALAEARALPPDARRPPLRAAIDLYRGDLLESEPALEWTVPRREGLRRAWRRAALELAELEAAAGDPAAALPPLEALLASDAADEAALRLLMSALAHLGRRDEALRRYEAGQAALRDELGVGPDAATRDLATAIRAADGPARPAAPPPAPPPRRWEEVPAPPSPLVGRERELERALDLLWQPGVRLVTLTGPGGVGKTRLALEIAAAMLGDLAQGACFVDLAPLHDPDLALPEVVRALGLDEEPGRTPLATLRSALRAAELLLTLDNFEQVLDAAPAVADLLAACPRLTVLATSREPLRLRAEHVLPLPPLGLPPAGGGRGRARPADLSRYAAPALFLQRARSVAPGAAVGEAEAAAIVEICARLDGLPLAIELAAARSRELPPPALLARLDRRLPELTAGYRDLPARQQTLRDAIAWSHDLLTGDEQALFRRLAVFVGGFDGAGAEAVSRGVEGSRGREGRSRSRESLVTSHEPETGSREAGADLSTPRPLDPSTPRRLDSLARKSLLRWDDDARGRMLETIREFALERLAASGEEAAARRAHLGYALAFAEAARARLDEPDQGVWLDRLEGDVDNLRAALEWALADDPERALRLAGSIAWFWKRRGHYREGLGWLERALAAAPETATAERALALGDAGWMAETLGDLDRAEALHGASLALARAVGDARATWRALNNLGIVARVRGDVEPSVAFHTAALAAARAAGDDAAVDVCLVNLANALLAAGDVDGAAHRLEESLAICRALGDPVRTAETLISVGIVALWQGDPAGAIAHYEESLAAFRAAGYASGIAIALSNLGEALIRTGEVERGVAATREAIERHRDLGDDRSTAIALINLAETAVPTGDLVAAVALLCEGFELLRRVGDRGLTAEVLEQAARLLAEQDAAAAALRVAGAAATLRRESGSARQPSNAALHDAAMAAARAALDARSAAAAWGAGLALGFDDGIDAAVAGLRAVAAGRVAVRPA